MGTVAQGWGPVYIYSVPNFWLSYKQGRKYSKEKIGCFFIEPRTSHVLCKHYTKLYSRPVKDWVLVAPLFPKS